MKLTWKLAARNLFRHRRRTLATGSAIVFGFSGLILLGSFILRIERTLRFHNIYVLMNGHLSIQKPDATNFFLQSPKKYQIEGDTLEKLKTVLEKYKDKIEFQGGFLEAQGLLSNGARSVPASIQSFEPELDELVRNHPLVQRWASDFLPSQNQASFFSMTQENPQVISATTALAGLLGRKPPFLELPLDQQELQLAARTLNGDFNAVDVLLKHHHATGIILLEDSSLRIPLSRLQELLDTKGVSRWAVYLKDEKDQAPLVKKLNQDFQEAGLQVEALPHSSETIGPYYVGTMSFMYTMALFFFILIFTAITISIVNTLTLGVIERTREIGTLRSLGFTSSWVSRLFVQETVILSAIAGLLSIIISQIVAAIVNQSHFKFQPPATPNPISFALAPEIWLCFGMILPMMGGIALISYFVVSRKTKTKIIELLIDTGARS